ncbi:MAG TPA: magnesium transporter [Bacilli bacterium]|nr:magnesium transporter [Bacilli bacterium]
MIKALLKQKLTKAEFQKALEEYHLHDVAFSLNELSNNEQQELFAFLSDEAIAEIISYLEPEDAAVILESFALKQQIKVIDEMTVDDAVDILQAYADESVREEVISELIDAEYIKLFIKYDEDTVGAYMNNEFVVIRPDMDVKEATSSLIRQAPEAETINTLFVIDETNHLLGIVNLRTLVKTKSPKQIKEIMIDIPIVQDTTLISEAIFDMKNYEVFELPVVNADNILIGMLTLDDALDIALEGAEEDFQQFAALPTRDTTRSIFKTALYRLPWLAVLMILSIPIITFTDLMTGAVAGIAILVFFQPLMLDSPGNVSTQTLAIALKAITNEGKMDLKDVFKEILSGIYTGLTLGLTTFVISFLFIYLGNHATIGFTREASALIYATIIGGSLLAVVMFAPLFAIGIPHLLKLVKVDPAVASGPFITTIIDLFSALVYFGLATLILQAVGMI